MRILTVLLVSRYDYLERVAESLARQTKPVEDLLIVLDGVSEGGVEQLMPSFAEATYAYNRKPPVLDRSHRHTATSHNIAKEYVKGYDFVWLIEDDGELPEAALESLVGTLTSTDADVACGVELNRHSRRGVGAWRANDIEEPTAIMTVENIFPSDAVQWIDGCGLYCALMKPEVYLAHDFHNSSLGLDVEFGLATRRAGYEMVIDWSVGVTHLTPEGDIPPGSHNDIITTLMTSNGWKRLDKV